MASFSMIRHFMRHEASGGVVLMVSALLAVILASSAFADLYEDLRHAPLGLSVAGIGISKSLLHWVNDGLMTIFFFLVGMEIKREILRGELSSVGRAMLPVVAAIGGMVVPAALYFALAGENPETARGWAIPVATDIAFALGVIALLGSRVPQSLKVLLTALAIIDDLGAILIIALFFTHDISFLALAIAAFAIVVMFALNASGVRYTALYILLGILAWAAVLESGVHATLAGVAAALAIPVDRLKGERASPLERLERALHPWVAFFILPIFGFLNAGVSLTGLDPSVALAPVTLGIAAGLFLGKQAGVLGAIFCAVRFRLAPHPSNANWMQIYGVALVTGIGFTMSLFIGELAFVSGTYETEVRLGVLGGSLLSAVAGYFMLRVPAQRGAAAN